MTFETRLKHWTTLGLGTVLMTGALAGCSEPTAPATDTSSEIVAPSPAPVSSDSLAASAGEGEGGVAIEAAYTDPVVYNAALAIAAAHVIAARDAFAAGEHDAAAEMYAHPVSEVLFDMDPVFQARGVTDFSDLFTETSAAVYTGEDESQIRARTDAILAALQAAATKAPSDGSSPASIHAKVTADLIGRASDMYRAARATDRYEPYLDGYGFYKAAAMTFEEAQTAIETENPDAAEAIRNALVALGEAYPGALRPTPMASDAQSVAVAASEVELATSR